MSPALISVGRSGVIYDFLGVHDHIEGDIEQRSVVLTGTHEGFMLRVGGTKGKTMYSHNQEVVLDDGRRVVAVLSEDVLVSRNTP